MNTSLTAVRKLRDSLFTDCDDGGSKRLNDLAWEAATALDHLAGEMVRTGHEIPTAPKEMTTLRASAPSLLPP